MARTLLPFQPPTTLAEAGASARSSSIELGEQSDLAGQDCGAEDAYCTVSNQGGKRARKPHMERTNETRRPVGGSRNLLLMPMSIILFMIGGLIDL